MPRLRGQREIKARRSLTCWFWLLEVLLQPGRDVWRGSLVYGDASVCVADGGIWAVGCGGPGYPCCSSRGSISLTARAAVIRFTPSIWPINGEGALKRRWSRAATIRSVSWSLGTPPPSGPSPASTARTQTAAAAGQFPRSAPTTCASAAGQAAAAARQASTTWPVATSRAANRVVVPWRM